MSIREVLNLGHPLLREKAKELSSKEIHSEDTKVLVQDMLQTMESRGGVGLAAPQIGVSKRLMIISISASNKRYPDAPETPLLAMINPKIHILNECPQGYWEGCLSIPGMRGFVERPKKVQVDFIDLRGVEQSLQLKGFLASAFQHELDHLDGILYIDRLKDTKKFSFIQEFLQFHDQQRQHRQAKNA